MRSHPSSDERIEERPTASPAMRAVIEAGERAAATDIPILIEGESGAGKEWLARRLHARSARADGPFVAVNCGAIPAQLVESILFGHEKGAFTGATERHRGKFAEADGGTLFLDEVGELPPEAQVKLLRALQEGEIEPVGARGPRRVSLRVVSATNRRLADEVREGRFREDLFYRLGAFPLTVPPLRERRDEIAALSLAFVGRLAATQGTLPERIAPEALAALAARDWPGNIRELENVIFRACVMARGETLTLADLAMPGVGALAPPLAPPLAPYPIAASVPPDAVPLRPPFPPSGGRSPVSPPPLVPDSFEASLPAFEGGELRALADLEREMIVLALQHYRGRMSEAARRLGIGRSTLYRKLREYGLSEEREAALAT